MKAFIYTGGTVYPDGIPERPAHGDLVIAADAGLRTAKSFGVVPTVAVGDFDTLGGLPEGEFEVVRLPAEKNVTDTQYAISLALERGATELTLVGSLGGRLDHTLSLLGELEMLSARKPSVPTVMTDGKNRVRLIRNSGTILLRGDFRYFSILALDPTVKGVTLDGCKYPLKNAKLSRSHQWAVSNEIVGNCALVEIRKGACLVIESDD